MSLSSAKAKLDAQGGDPVTGYISKTDHQESYDELVDDTALTGATTAEAITVSGAAVAATINGRDPDDLVLGPASATDNALVRFDGTGGKTVQNSGITVDDSGNLVLEGSNLQVRFTNTAGSGKELGLLSGTSGGALVYDVAGSFYIMSNSSAAITAGTGGSGATVRLTVSDTGKTTLGSVGATAGLELGSSGPRDMAGTGSPEGVVTAPVGSTWRDTNATTGAIKWIKASSGSGSSGWVVEYGDTGVRNLSAVALSNGWTVASSVFFLRRVGGMVHLTMGVDKTSTTSDVFYTLPSGFRPAFHTYYGSSSATDDYADGGITAAGSANLGRSRMVASTHYFTAVFATADPWPSSLPGV